MPSPAPDWDLPDISEGWQEITQQHATGGPYVVTNNIEACNAFGEMSHVWVTDFIQRSAEPETEGTFICFDGNLRKIHGLTHYYRIPKPCRSIANNSTD